MRRSPHSCMDRIGVLLELVVETEAEDALVHLADDGVAVLEVHAEVLGEFILDAGTQVEAHMVLLVGNAMILKFHHRIVHAGKRIDVELLVPQAYQIMGIEVDIPTRSVVVRKESVEAHLGAQLVQNAILEPCAQAKTLDLAAIHEVDAGGRLALMYLSLSEAKAEHHCAY